MRHWFPPQTDKILCPTQFVAYPPWPSLLYRHWARLVWKGAQNAPEPWLLSDMQIFIQSTTFNLVGLTEKSLCQLVVKVDCPDVPWIKPIGFVPVLGRSLEITKSDVGPASVRIADRVLRVKVDSFR